MKTFSHRNLNNRGVSFLLVVIALGFISVLGTIVATAAVKNITMKTVDKKSKEDFYSAEAALEEIKAGITEITANVMADSYETVLKEYSSTNTAQRNKIFINTFLDGIKMELQVSPSDQIIPAAVIKDLLKETKKAENSHNGAEIIGTPVFKDTLKNDKSVMIQNIKVVYSLDGYTQSITTDLKITVPDISSRKSTTGFAHMPYKDFALIGNQAITAGFSSHNIKGSVYAGADGLLVSNEGNTMKINGTKIISAGNIEAMDKSKLLINGNGAEIWATNLITSGSDKKANTNLETSLRIDGHCYIKDDLILDAKKSKVELTGEYYGYSNGTDAASNSAIMINAINSSLQLKGLSKLYLAGRAFISMDNTNVTYELDQEHGVSDRANSNILTGESLIVKGSQGAYLLPDKFISAGHNPITWDEYTNYYNNPDKDLIKLTEDSIVFTNPSISAEESKLYYYVDPVKPFKKEFYKFGLDSNVVYFYLNFKSKEAATDYLKNYEICYPGKIYNGFPITEITINHSPDTVNSAGNLLTYEDSLKITPGNNGLFTNNYELQYSNLSKTLEKNITGEGTVFDYLIHGDRIKEDGALKGGQALLINNGYYYVNVVDNRSFGVPLFFKETNKEGIIIATGDIEVCSDFKGLIISGGKITLYNGANLNADSELISSILSENAKVRRYFKEFDTNNEDETGASFQKFAITDLIQYENWKKK
ncbi:hypothetical protein [Anaerocolumna sp. MB42-C2]|uniref:hypothetical protein n=1 Tax=Anaerocolumna sp. MB42-C2 TaxID=3070997 RepID=UPI0027E125EB|nr:hypothetical protein [Anaerocolumna sp. MB42-C2]WMJ88589.1 hypothetical protein RBU59_03480 [Anaerocolumna sp. MB42-C2]